MGSAVTDRTHVRKLNLNESLIAHCREVLGQHGDALSDEEIDELRCNAEEMARLLIGMFLAQSSPTERR
jgi:hypothetical protein